MEEYNPYCDNCHSCGEEACCSPIHCKQNGGKYCKSNLKHLKFGYQMYLDTFELLEKHYKEELDRIYDENYKIFYDEYLYNQIKTS